MVVFLFVNRSYDTALATIVAKLAKVDTLPGAEVETAIGNGNGERGPEERALGMSRHIVGSLHRVGVVRLILLDEVVHDAAEVGAYVWIGILIDREGT